MYPSNMYTAGLKLKKGFYLRSQIEADKHHFLHIDELCEEHQPDDQYVGPSNHCLTLAFHIVKNVMKDISSYFISKNKTYLNPFGCVMLCVHLT